MTDDPVAEYEHVRKKYEPMRASDVAVYLAGLIVLAIASLIREVGWFFYAGMVSGAAAWEVTKSRLRRNAQRFAGTSQRL